jgi:hypothetical protein
VLDTLTAAEALPVAAAQQLAAARAAVTREALADTAGEAVARVQTGAVAIERTDPEGGRVEIQLAARSGDDEP